MSEEQDDDDRRASTRRWVMMRVLVGDEQSVQFSNTVNISDTGLLIERQPGLDLAMDQHVNVVVQGMISEGEEASEEGRLMMVVRVTDANFALTFLD